MWPSYSYTSACLRTMMICYPFEFVKSPHECDTLAGDCLLDLSWDWYVNSSEASGRMLAQGDEEGLGFILNSVPFPTKKIKEDTLSSMFGYI